MIIEFGHLSIVPHLAQAGIQGDNQKGIRVMIGSVNGRRRQGLTLIGALCFGAAFGFPFIVWGVILIVDRDRAWQRKLRRGRKKRPPQRTRAWDRRQITFGSLLILFGIAVLLLLSAFNYWAQGISPPAPF